MEQQKGYEVIRFITHGSGTRIAMDYIPGRLLRSWIKEEKKLSKNQFFGWLWMLVDQMNQFYCCSKNQCYRYLGPESILVTEEGRLYLLDLEAESNAFVVQYMKKQNIRQLFTKKELNYQGNMRLETDLYTIGKTIQYILAHVPLEPKLTRKEERKISVIIEKCLGNHSKKIYQNLNQIKNDIPKKRKRIKMKSIKKSLIMVILFAILGTTLVISDLFKEEKVSPSTEKSVSKVQEDQAKDTVKEKTEYIQTEMQQLQTDIGSLQESMQQNNAEDNQRVINEGMDMEREVLRYLATAYDREEEYEEAVSYYQKILDVENSQEQLEIVVLRKAVLEIRLGKIEEAAKTYGQGRQLCPQSQEIGNEYLKFLCEYGAESSEARDQKMEELLHDLPELIETDNFQKLQQEYGIKIEGEKVWVEKK